MNLFDYGVFKLHSGNTSYYKIDCDALTDKDIESLAFVISQQQIYFSSVFGIPTGGLRLANALQQFAEPNRLNLPILIVDDVYTTGNSMREFKAKIKREYPDIPVIGIVVFDRSKKGTYVPNWIGSLFKWQDPYPKAS